MSASSSPLHVALVGLGHLHPRAYMPHFQGVPGVRVVAVAEADAKLREPFCKEFSLRGYVSLDDLLAKEKIEVAAIFLPHADCPAAAEDCAARGIHLMVEKPMAASSAGARRIADAAKKGGVRLTTGYAWRFHPVAREFKRIVREGLVGRVVGAEGRCAAGRLQRYLDGGSPWMLRKALSGGGPMYNLGVHWIDLFRWMFEDEVAEVSGRNVKVNADYDIEDNSFAHLRFRGGAIAALDISYTVPDAFPYGRDLYLSVRGMLGAVMWAPAFEGEKDRLFVCSDHPAFVGAPRVTREFELQPTPGYVGFMGREYVRAFMDAVRSGRPPPVTGDDGIAALKVVEAIYRSDAEKKWVAVDE